MSSGSNLASLYVSLNDLALLYAAERMEQLMVEAMSNDHSLKYNAKCDRGELVHVW